MKKLITFLLLSVCLVNLYAQDRKILVGLKAGINIASISNTPDVNFNSPIYGESDTKTKLKFLPHIGVFSEFKLSDGFSIQPELLFNMKGVCHQVKAENNGNSYKSETNFVLSYLDIPVQLKFNCGKSFHILAGPYLGFLLSAKTKVDQKETIGNTTSKTEYKDDSKDGLNSPEVGLYLGVGWETETGLGFGVRYCRAFTDLTENTAGDDAHNNNHMLQLSVIYKFGN